MSKPMPSINRWSVKYQIVLPVCLCILVNTVALTYFSVNLTRDTLFQKEYDRLRDELLLLSKTAEMGLLTENADDLQGPLRPVMNDPVIKGVAVYFKSGVSMFTSGEYRRGAQIPPDMLGRFEENPEGAVLGSTSNEGEWCRQTELYAAVYTVGQVQGDLDELILESAKTNSDQGERRLCGYAGIKVDLSHIDISVWTITWRSIAIASVLVFTGFVITFLVAWKMGSSLSSLMYGAERVGRGNFDVRMKVKGNDEIAHLTDAFNRMTMELELQRHSIEEHNAHLEERVLERTAQLEEASERAQAASLAKSEFLANMSHEIRTPMNGILGMSEILAGTRMTKAQKECHTTISSCATTLLNLLNDILDLSKIEHGQLELEWIPLDLKKILQEVVDINTYVALEKGIDLGFEVGDEVPASVKGDSLRIRQILINLCGNALKFTEEGSVTIRAELEREEGDTSWIRFVVEDTGIGIPSDKQQSIFDIFSQADGSHTRKYGGTGLGLTISKQLVDLFQGRIWLVSMEGEGTRFYFSLPLIRVEEKTAPPRKKKKAAKKPATSRKKKTARTASPRKKKKTSKKTAPEPPCRILLAEDNPVNQKVATKLLQKAGFEVEAVENGKEALDALEKGTFDLVLMDVQMPVLDGLSASLEIRKIDGLENLPIIAVTAHALEEDRQRCLDAKMNDYITKPVRLEELIPMIRSWLPGGENHASLARKRKAKAR